MKELTWKIDPKEALIFHYNPYCISITETINDTTIFRYKSRIQEFINEYNLTHYFINIKNQQNNNFKNNNL